nr:MAG TPA: hypothetical protein [Herelleviridae sp.]DAU67068.1 MAG TPA: hypothetical protein [Caudoviricetes sp.]
MINTLPYMLINQGDYMPFYTKIVKWYISIQKSVPGSTKTLYLLVRYLHRRLLLPIF